MNPSTVILAGLLGSILVAAIVFAVIASAVRRRRQAENLSAIDFARGSFASQLNRGVEMNELLLQLVEALHDTFKLDAAELWLCEDGRLRLVAAEPRADRDPIALTEAELSIAANARVSSAAWAKVWMPALVGGRNESNLRLAPISHSGQLFGLIVADRAHRAESLAVEADATLEEVAREVGMAVNKARVDAALQQSLGQLRLQAAELQASRARLVVAADGARRKIERDLHDGAQQHLVALAVKLRLLEQVTERDPARARELMEQLPHDVKETIEELRSLAHGIYPPLLSDAGLKDALAAACRRAPLPTSFEGAEVGRHPPEVESAVYFSCLEALQNAGKHAGRAAAARVHVWEGEGELRFEVADDGSGFHSQGAEDGAGLTNMRDRLGAVGGTLKIESGVGTGTIVRGCVPLNDPVTGRGAVPNLEAGHPSAQSGRR
jgi:signal transduction histidine kinase